MDDFVVSLFLEAPIYTVCLYIHTIYGSSGCCFWSPTQGIPTWTQRPKCCWQKCRKRRRRCSRRKSRPTSGQGWKSEIREIPKTPQGLGHVLSNMWGNQMKLPPKKWKWKCQKLFGKVVVVVEEGFCHCQFGQMRSADLLLHSKIKKLRKHVRAVSRKEGKGMLFAEQVIGNKFITLNCTITSSLYPSQSKDENV